MKFDVQRKTSYKLTKYSLERFKERMIECLEEWGEGNKYSIEDISDDIVEAALKDAIQDAFEDCEYYQGGITFDDYFKEVFLDCGEEDVYDCICDAVEKLKRRLKE